MLIKKSPACRFNPFYSNFVTMTMVDKSIPSIFKEGFIQTVYIEFGQPN